MTRQPLDLSTLKREIRRTVRHIDPSARRVELVIMDSDGQTTRSEINLWVPPPDEPGDSPDDEQSVMTLGARGRTVRVVDKVYSFTKMQAPAVEVLYAAWVRGTYDVPDADLLRVANTEAVKVSDLFRGSPAWGTLVIEGGSRGTHRLTMPGEAFE